MVPKATHLKFTNLHLKSSPLLGVIPVSSAGIFDQHRKPPRTSLHLLVSGIFLSPQIPQLPLVKLQALTSNILTFHIILTEPSKAIANKSLKRSCRLLPSNCCFLLEHKRHTGKEMQYLTTLPVGEKEKHLQQQEQQTNFGFHKQPTI